MTVSPSGSAGPAQLSEKLLRWFDEPAIRAKGWAPRLFWRIRPDGKSSEAKVDECELEVFFATILGQPSECYEILEGRSPGRAEFIAANARRHELPYFTPR